MKKIELEQQNAELKAQLEELQKKEQTMTNTNTADKTAKTNEFNAFNYVKLLLVIASKRNENEIRMRQTNRGILNWLQKAGAISSYEITISDTYVDEQGKNYVLVKVEDINLDVKAISKAGKEFYVFDDTIRGKGERLAKRNN